jgi:hypothetical protein
MSKPTSKEFRVGHFGELIKAHALARVKAQLPAKMREGWSEGDFTIEDASDDCLIVNVALKNENTHKTISWSMMLPKSIKRTPANARLQGCKVGEGLMREIKGHWSLQGDDGDGDYDNQKYFNTRSQPKNFNKHSARSKKATRGRTVKPKPCEICGPEDKDTFPDWGPCPHRSKT